MVPSGTAGYATAVLVLTACVVGAVAAQDTTVSTDEPSATIAYEGDSLLLHNGPGQQVSGETNLDAGTVVTVFIESDSMSHPFLKTPQAVVDSDGAFTANVSLETVDARANATAKVQLDNERISDEVPVELRPCNGQCPDETVPSGPESDASDAERPDDTEQPDSSDPSDGEAADADGDAELVDQVVWTYRGETAWLNLSLEGSETVAVTVTNEDAGYEAAATVRDGDGDGRVPVLFDTAVGTTDEPISVAGSADALVNSTQTRGDVAGTLPASNYDVDVYRTAALEERIALGTLAVEQLTEAPRSSADANRSAGAAAADGDTADEDDGGDGAANDSGDGAADDGGGGTPIPADRDTILLGGGIVGVLAVVGVGARLLR